MAYYGLNSEQAIGLTGLVLTHHPADAQDVIHLLQHDEGPVRLAAIAACAALSLSEALPFLKSKAAILSKEWMDFESGQSDKRFYEMESVYQELSAVNLTRALLGEEAPFSLFTLIPITYGTGVMGFLGCSLPTFSQAKHDSVPTFGRAKHDREDTKSLLDLGHEIMLFRYLEDMSFWRGFFTVPHFWHNLVAQDLAPVTWLDEYDKQSLLASIQLMEVQFYEEMPVLTPPPDLPNMNEALREFAQTLSLSEGKEALYEHVISIIERLEKALEVKLLAQTFIESDQPELPATFQERFADDFEFQTSSWQRMQAYCKEIANAYCHALTSDSFSFYDREDLIQLAFILVLGGDRFIQEIFQDTPEFVWTDEPDPLFFTELRDFGRYLLIFEAVHLWGVGMVQLLQKAYADDELGVDHLSRWTQQAMGLSTWVHLKNAEDEPGENGRFLKKNPLASVYEPFP